MGSRNCKMESWGNRFALSFVPNEAHLGWAGQGGPKPIITRRQHVLQANVGIQGE